MSEGIFFVDFKRALAPLIEGRVDINSIEIENYFLISFKKDEFYSNNDFSQFSNIFIDGYKKWSDFMKEKFPGYRLNEEGKILPNEGKEKLNFDKILRLFLSKEWNLDEENHF